ncbi:hypothetical protein D3Z52_02590 [Clostridiaceae bacterium]|nr:hypothetical protein [Clostridiaceae bacterium]
MDDIRETAWDHISGEKRATFSTSEKKWIREIQRLHEQYPDEVDIRCVNKDGSILAYVPVEWLRIRPKKKSNLSAEQIAASKARLELARQKRLDDLRKADAAVATMEGGSK